MSAVQFGITEAGRATYPFMDPTNGNLKSYRDPIDKCCKSYAELVVEELILTFPESRYAIVLRVRVIVLLY